MTVKEEAKKPGWYGLAMGLISLALAIVGYLDTQAKAKQAEDIRVKSDEAIADKLIRKVEKLEDELRDLHIAIGILQGGLHTDVPVFLPDVGPIEEKTALPAPIKLTPPEELFAPEARKKARGEARDELRELIQQRAY